MLVREAMSTRLLTIGPDHTLRHAARLMARRRIGAAVVHDAAAGSVGILTERDILSAVAAGQDPDRERAGSHLTGEASFAAPDWTLADAAAAMTARGLRHLVVVERERPAGIVSVRDIISCWTPVLTPR